MNIDQNLRNRPTATSHTENEAIRSAGSNPEENFKNRDPIGYFNQKLKTSRFYSEEFWSEAARRGETEHLIGLLQASNNTEFNSDLYDVVSAYGGRLDYDTYMLSLEAPHLDNTTKEDIVDPTTGTSLGKFTQQGWATEILSQTTNKWNAEIIDDNKETSGFFEQLGVQSVAGLTNIVGGALQFVGDIYNLGEGLLNMAFNWSNDSGLGTRFLYAFSNDDTWTNPFAKSGEWLNAASFEFQRQFSATVSATKAYEEGYELGEGNNFFTRIDNAVGVGTGYNTWGRWMNAGTNAIGYMIPTIILGTMTSGATTAAQAGGISVSSTGLISTASAGTKIAASLNHARSLVFYAGIFSGSLKDRVVASGDYRKLKPNEVILNAAIKSAAQYGVEKALGMVLGFSGVDKLLGMGGKTIYKAGSKAAVAATKTGLEAAATVLARGAKNALKEGLEETLQELSDFIVDYGFNGSYRSEALQNISMQNLIDSFVVGALSSIVMGSFSGLVVDRNQLNVGVNADGSLFKLGTFQRLNLRQAVATMHEWQEVIQNPNASIEDRAAAMLKMNSAVTTLGDIYKNMGTERAVKADAIINDMLNTQDKIEQIKKMGTAETYAKTIWNDFNQIHKEASVNYLTEKLEAEIVKALEKEEKVLKEANVTKVEAVVTEKGSSEEAKSTLEDSHIKRFQKALAKFGVDVIVGVDGEIVTKSDKVLIVSNKLINTGDLETILKSTSYKVAVDAVKKVLSYSQKDMIIQSYADFDSTYTGELELAIKALLFDKNFYTYILLKSKERNYQSKAFAILATLDQLIAAKVTPNVENGTVLADTYKLLMTKVRGTMRTGLVTVATQHQLIDTSDISNAILTPELKTLINNHRNVIFSKQVNEALYDKSLTSPSIDVTNRFDELLENVISKLPLMTQILIDTEGLKRSARSTNYNDRFDAWVVLTFFAKLAPDESKLVYLSTYGTNYRKMSNTLDSFEIQVGITLRDFAVGNKLEKLKPEFVQSVGANYDLTSKRERLSLSRNLVRKASSDLFTVSEEGFLLQVLDKEQSIKEEFLTVDGLKNLNAKILKGGMKVKDLLKVETGSFLANISIVDLKTSDINAVIKNDPSINAVYNSKTQTIYVRTGSLKVIDSLMHEITHITQDDSTDGGITTDRALGGNDVLLANLNWRDKTDILNYIQTNFPLVYKHLGQASHNNLSTLYFMLAGELEANRTKNSQMNESGFMWRGTSSDPRQFIVSPDGKKKWTLRPSPLSKMSDFGVTSFDKELEPEIPTRRKVSNVEAAQSNLKYWIKKGKPIQVNPKIQNFVKATTTDFDKLSTKIKDKIKEGSLTIYDIKEVVATATNMNDYTFRAIAKYVYGNDELAKLTFKDMLMIADNITGLASLNYIMDDYDTKYSPKEMLALLIKLNEDAKFNSDLETKLATVYSRAASLKYKNTNGDTVITEVEADMLQANPIFFNNYDGTFASIRRINNLAKLLTVKQEAAPIAGEVADDGSIIENEEGELAEKRKTDVWKWLDYVRKAEIDYTKDTDLNESLDDISRNDKIDAITEYVTEELVRRAKAMSAADKKKYGQQLFDELEAKTSKLHLLSDEELNKRYTATLANEISKPADREAPEVLIQVDENTPRSKKNIKDHLRQSARTISKRIAGLKHRYNSLPEDVKKHIDPTTYKITKDYTTMEQPELETLLEKFKTASIELKDGIKNSESLNKRLEIAQRRLETETKKRVKAETKLKDYKASMREKINVLHRTKITNQKFEFVSREEIPSLVKDILNTQWGKTRMSEVRGVTNNVEQNAHTAKAFLKNNAVSILSMSLADIEQTIRWFLDPTTKMTTEGPESQTFLALKIYLLGYIFSETKENGIYSGIDHNLKQKLENYLKDQATAAGTALSVWRGVANIIDPWAAMQSADMEMDGVLLTTEEKTELMNAAIDVDMERITQVQAKIVERVSKERTSKKSILRRITTARSMSMLTSPITWLRNKVANAALKNLNKLSSKIGDKIASNRTQPTQFKMNGKITPEIQNFINEHFLDNGLYDTLLGSLSKYTPSDIAAHYKDATGKASKDAIFHSMVIKALYNQYYNQNIFNSKNLNKFHQFLMKMLTDNNYVREAAVRYFGKIIAERGYDLTKGVTDNIMNDFAAAVGIGMADYMHSDNIFNKVETVLAEKSETLLFVYKLILPYASAQWNWFKAAIRYSPIGLGQSIIKLAKLEQEVIKAESNWAQGKSQVMPELTEFNIRRDIGSGVIGTLSLLFGATLAALGYVDLEDEDYGTPKLRIGNIRVDVSTIFGTSSALAGMALVKSLEDVDGNLLTSLDAMLEPLLDGFFLTQILELDQYNRGGFASFGVNFLEQTILSFIPNGLRWLASSTYSGKLVTDNIYKRAVSRINFFNVFGLEKKVNPYSGSSGDMWDAFSRFVPYLEVRKTSAIEEDSKALGINKTQLRGNYVVNGEPFELNASDVAELNKQYGEWNAKILTEFYSNQSRHKVRNAKGVYQVLTHDQMTDIQRSNVVQNIFTKNAEYAKIAAWLKAGNSYYGSDLDYTTLKKLKVKGSLYKGTKGYVKK